MRSLLNLNINIQARNGWGDRFQEYCGLWVRPWAPFDLCELDSLETLKIPLRLFMEIDEVSMHRSSSVLPATLETLVLTIDLQLHSPEPLYNEESVWRGNGDGRPAADRRSCAETIRLAIEFLEDIQECAGSAFPDLRTLTLEYKIDEDFGDRDWSFRTEALEEFLGKLQYLRAGFHTQMVHFSWKALWPDY